MVLRTEVRVPTIHSRVQPAAVLSVAATPARGQFVNAPGRERERGIVLSNGRVSDILEATPQGTQIVML